MGRRQIPTVGVDFEDRFLDMTIRVAIIDDHPSIAWGLERLIATEAPRMECVGSATDLESAAKLIDQLRPDVVMLDLDLNGRSGVSLISGAATEAGVRFLVYTGLRDPGLQEAAMVAGARGILAKTEPPEAILRAITCVHAGELWLDRTRTGNLFDNLRRQASAPPTRDPFSELTTREREIVAMILAQSGAPNKRIAEQLGISEHTLRNALSTIYAKTGMANRLQLFALASGRSFKHTQR